MVGHKAIAASICALLVLTVPLTVLAAPSLTQYEQQEQQVNGQLSSAQGQYDAAQRSLLAADTRVRQLDADLVAGADKLTQLKGQVGSAQQVLSTRQAAAQSALQKEKFSHSAADEALVTVYKGSRVQTLDVLLGATSFSDFLTRARFLWSVWMAALQELRQAQSDRRAADAAQTAAQAALKQVQTLEADAAQELEVIQGKAASAHQAWLAEQTAVANVHAAIASLLSEKAGLQAAIQKLLAELRAGTINWSQLSQLVDQLAQQYGVDPRLVEAVIIQESGGDARARSSAGAEGLMQLMPGTAAALGVQDPLDPVQNVRGGITYLMEMLQKFNGNLSLALAAYNAGPGAVEQYGGVPPYAQTQRYVQDVLQLYKEGK